MIARPASHDRLSDGNAVFSDYCRSTTSPVPASLRCCAARFSARAGIPVVQCAAGVDLHGDTGSLALGGMLGATAVAVKHEIVLAVIGAVRAGSSLVIVQVVSFKLTASACSDGAAASPFRAEGLDRAADRDPVWIISVMPGRGRLSTLKLVKR